MKRYILGLILAISIFFVFGVVHADEKKSCNDLSSKAAQEACKKIEEYCNKDVGGEKGCNYSPSHSLMNNARASSNNRGLFRTFNYPKLPLTRGYSGVDKDGLGIFAGCYKYEMKSDQGKFPAGTYFIFQYFLPNSSGTCSMVDWDVVPAKGLWDYNGQEGIGAEGATYYWTATNGGACPLLLGVTGNTTALTAQVNKFVFADTEAQLQQFDSRQFRFDFWNIEDYVINAACTVQDKEGLEKAVACYDDAITKIKNKTCPTDLSDIAAFKAELDGLANKCSPYEEILYKHSFLVDNANNFKQMLSTSINEKLTSCQYGKCNLSSTNITNLTNALNGKACQNGCAGKTGTAYDDCIKCLETAFNSCGLTSEQKKCLLDSQKAKDEAVEELEKQIEEEQEEHVEEEMKEAQEIRESIYNRYSGKTAAAPEVELPPEDGKLGNCETILGSNLTAIVKVSITIIQIAGAIIAIVKGMMTLIPPILAKDADALKKASKTLTTMAIVLVIIFLFRPILRFIGNILDFDTSCII